MRRSWSARRPRSSPSRWSTAGRSARASRGRSPASSRPPTRLHSTHGSPRETAARRRASRPRGLNDDARGRRPSRPVRGALPSRAAPGGRRRLDPPGRRDRSPRRDGRRPRPVRRVAPGRRPACPDAGGPGRPSDPPAQRVDRSRPRDRRPADRLHLHGRRADRPGASQTALEIDRPGRPCARQATGGAAKGRRPTAREPLPTARVRGPDPRCGLPLPASPDGEAPGDPAPVGLVVRERRDPGQGDLPRPSAGRGRDSGPRRRRLAARPVQGPPRGSQIADVPPRRRRRIRST